MIHYLKALCAQLRLARICHNPVARELLDTLISINSASVDPGGDEGMATPSRAEQALR